MFVSGMHITFGILNHPLWAQTWTYYVANTTVMLVIMSWYLAVIVGLILGKFLIKKYEKKTIGVRVFRLTPLSYFKSVFLLQFIALAIYTVSGVLFIAAPNIPTIIALGRICSGVGHGIIYLSTIIHGAEIVVKQIRGMILATPHYCLLVGIFSGTAINMIPNSPNSTLGLRLVGIATLIYVAMGALFGYFLIHESPVFLIQRHRELEARQIMKRLRNDTVETYEMVHDFDELRTMVAEDQKLSKSIFSDGNARPLIIISVLRLLNVLTFNSALNVVRLSLAQRFLTSQFVDFAVSGVRFLGGSLTLLTFDVVKRKKYFLVTSIASCIALSVLVILYNIVSVSGDWAIAATVLAFDFFAGLAIGQLTDIYSSEAFPCSKKLDSLIATNVLENVLHVILVIFQYYYSAYTIILSVSIALMAICTVFLIVKLPETMKKSIRETRDLFRGHGATFYH
jgi:hypothetical protein